MLILMLVIYWFTAPDWIMSLFILYMNENFRLLQNEHDQRATDDKELVLLPLKAQSFKKKKKTNCWIIHRSFASIAARAITLNYRLNMPCASCSELRMANPLIWPWACSSSMTCHYESLDNHKESNSTYRWCLFCKW